jgi:hypothetical protein
MSFRAANHARSLLLLVTAVCACSLESEPTGPPLGMTLANDGVIYAGVAMLDLTPTIRETFTDINDNHEFDGCVDDPTASGEECDEPFDDVNGNGRFDPVWIGGFGPKRPALSVRDPIYARAVVLSYDESYIAIVSLDVVGLGSPRIHEARDRLVGDGFDGDRLLVASSHNHQGPDTMGLWGDPETFTSGLDLEYQVRLAEGIEQVVRKAAATMLPVTLQVGAIHTSEVSPKWFNGKNFGGKNPSDIMYGLVYDGRDPVIASDQLLVVQGRALDDQPVFTLTNWSGHPEVRASSNNALSSDYVGVLREALEAEYGGMALHMPESLGGMQSALNGDVPMVDESGEHQFQSCDAVAIADSADSECFGKSEGAPRLDEDGEAVPVWATRNSWDFVTSLGWHIAEAAMLALSHGEAYEQAPIRMEAANFLVPIENETYNLLAAFDMFELGLKDAVIDYALCPELGTDTAIGCLDTRTFRLRLGPVGFTAVPGELLPELAWGFPEADPRWQAEVGDPTKRGSAAGAVYFPQHDPNCNDIEFSACSELMTLDDCDCLSVHAWPYTLSNDVAQRPLLDAWDSTDVSYRAVIGMADNYLSYIIPEPDFNRSVTLLTDEGDHYEDTVSPVHDFATRMQKAQAEIDARW